MSHPPFILASNSPRRRELLTLTDQEFEIFPVMIDETPWTDELPESYVIRISQEKAVAAVEKLKKNGILISADTIVVDQGRIIGKPLDENHARQILRGLRDHSHVVYTALIVYNLSTAGMEKDLCSSRVPMRNYSDNEIDDYISSGDPMDKAGAYAVQHPGFHPVENFKGCFASVMGFPLCHLTRTLRRMNISIRNDIAVICQKHLNYTCPIFSEVLDGNIIG